MSKSVSALVSLLSVACIFGLTRWLLPRLAANSIVSALLLVLLLVLAKAGVDSRSGMRRGRRRRRYAAAARLRMLLAIPALAMALPVSAQTGTEPLLQQIGSKLMGAGDSAHAEQGNAVGISADGNTAVVGAFSDTVPGSAAIFTNVLGVWTQQGARLMGTGGVGSSQQGYATAISGDGNTVVVGGQADNTTAGAVWIFTRSAGVWTQQGAKLVGTGAAGGARQGWSAALSADGNTALVGGPHDNSGAGAAWVFTRSGAGCGRSRAAS